MRTTLVLLCAALVATATARGAAAPDQSEAADAAAIIQQFLDRDEPALVQYRALRRLEARNERFDNNGWMDVCTELQGGRFTYRIIEEGGSSYVRGRVLRPVLEGEQKAWTSGEVQRATLTPRNYRFLPLGVDERGIVKIGLKPLRRDRMLVEGVMVLTRDDADLIRIDGRLAKNPSFWTSRVQIRRSYARVAGVRVPVTLESSANVRMAGRSTFRMTYKYLVVNDRPLATAGRCANLAG